MPAPAPAATRQAIIEAYGAAQRRATLQAVLRAEQLWKQLDTADLSGSWVRGLGNAMVRAVAAGQLLAASSGQKYVDAVVAADGLTSDYTDGADTVAYRAFSGAAADGRTLDSLLYMPVIRTKTLLQGGVTLQEAMLGGMASLSRMVASEVADAGSGAAGVAMVANRSVTGYIRMVRSGACARCVILAGRWYRYNADFQRHKRCFPAGVVVSGPRTLAATRRWYEGELVILATASGEQLPATGNHPILTRRGWVAANLIQEGDEVVRSLRPEGATPLVVPDHQQVPSRIEDVWSAHSVAGLVRVPTSAEDFHGDGGHGEVDVVGPNRFLWGELDSAFLEQASENYLAFGSLGMPGIGFPGLGANYEVLFGGDLSSHGGVGRLCEPGLFLAGQLGHAQGIGLGAVPQMHSGGLQVSTYDSTHDPVVVRDRLLALASLVGVDEFREREGYGTSPRWDAIGVQGSVEDAATDARVGLDLLGRLAGQVELDRVVEVRRISWSGHVYDLNSTEGWFNANRLIVSNCQCYGAPATKVRGSRYSDPMDFFNSLSKAEQDARFGVGDAEAIREGADIYSVVNAHRGVQTLDAYGQKVVATLEGTSRRGAYYRQAMQEAEARTGQRYARSFTDVQQGLPRFTLRSPRLTPSEIYRLAESRDELIRLLKRFGYLS